MSTLADVIEPFLADLHRRLRPNTVRAYRADLVIAAADLPQPLNQISSKAIEAFLADPTVAKSTACRRAATLSRLFQWAVREGHAEKNPLDQAEPVQIDRRLPRPVPAGDQRKDIAKAISSTGGAFSWHHAEWQRWAFWNDAGAVEPRTNVAAPEIGFSDIPGLFR